MKFITGRDEAVLLVSNSIIHEASRMGLNMTHMKLQKLIYFVYKRFLEDNGTKLFDNVFEAWQHGPVVRIVWEQYRDYGAASISNIYVRTDRSGDNRVVSFQRRDFYDALHHVLDMYGDNDGWDLRNKTHMPNSAWSIAMERDHILCDEEIRDEVWHP